MPALQDSAIQALASDAGRMPALQDSAIQALASEAGRMPALQAPLLKDELRQRQPGAQASSLP
jgi:hypothetical protein